MATFPRVVRSVAEAQRWVAARRQAGLLVGIVPTMGALHEGHLSLVRRSTSECGATAVTLFVNPKQFLPNEDFHRYPRQFEQDLAMLAPLGVEVLFSPSTEEMYPHGFATQVEVAGLTSRWEGAVRPGHFDGVTTVVCKLFNALPADRAYFGQKDYQQLVVVRRMAADLNLPIEVVMCPTVRDQDGLALSSRNAYLSESQRKQALSLSRGLATVRKKFADGERNAQRLSRLLEETASQSDGLTLDYAAVVEPDTLEELDTIKSQAVAIVAARVGNTRLIDNEILALDRSLGTSSLASE